MDHRERKKRQLRETGSGHAYRVTQFYYASQREYPEISHVTLSLGLYLGTEGTSADFRLWSWRWQKSRANNFRLPLATVLMIGAGVRTRYGGGI